MKFMPLTPFTLKELIKDEYTHLILKNYITAQDRDFAGNRDIYQYEAIRGNANTDTVNNETVLLLASQLVTDMIRRDEHDYQILVKDMPA